MNPFLRGHTKKGSLWETSCWQKSRKNFRASLGDFGQRSTYPKICLLLHLCPGVGQKYFCRGVQKWRNFIFTSQH